MATHCSILAWTVPWTEEPGELQSIGLQRVGHDWNDLTCMNILMFIICGIYYIFFSLFEARKAWKKWMNPCLTAKEKIEWGRSGLLIMNPLTFLYLTKCCIQRRWWHPTPVLLPGKSHGRRSLVGCSQSVGSLRVGHNWATSFSLSCFREGNGNPLQCSCLENLRDRGAWWAAVYGVTQIWTRLKWLSSSSSSSKCCINLKCE